MPTQHLTINIYPSTDYGAVTPPSGDYTKDSYQTITAFPVEGYAFGYFTGDLTGAANPQVVRMTMDRTVNAYFVPAYYTDVGLSVPSVDGSFNPIMPTESIAVPTPSVDGSMQIISNNDIEGAVLKDNSPLAYWDYTSQANDDVANDVQLLPSTTYNADAFYFGVSSVKPYGFIRYLINIGTAGAGSWTLSYYYYNGSAWVVIPADKILMKSDQFLNFRTAGFGSLWIIPPDDWAVVSVNGVTLYWIEARVFNYSSKATTPLGTRIYQSPFGNAVKIMKNASWKVVRQAWQMENSVWKPTAEIEQMVSTVWKEVPIG
jgi:hypothetical protein